MDRFRQSIKDKTPIWLWMTYQYLNYWSQQKIVYASSDELYGFHGTFWISFFNSYPIDVHCSELCFNRVQLHHFDCFAKYCSIPLQLSVWNTRRRRSKEKWTTQGTTRFPLNFRQRFTDCLSFSTSLWMTLVRETLHNPFLLLPLPLFNYIS